MLLLLMLLMLLAGILLLLQLLLAEIHAVVVGWDLAVVDDLVGWILAVCLCCLPRFLKVCLPWSNLSCRFILTPAGLFSLPAGSLCLPAI